MRIFAVSDLHTDYETNAVWVKNLSNHDFTQDCLILAGDISDTEQRIVCCFEQLATKFNTVLFVPGNHDIWVRKNAGETSIDKFLRLLGVAAEHGIKTRKTVFGSHTIIPLFSWYDLSFGTTTPALTEQWMDFYRCKWPQGLEAPEAQNAFFLNKNAQTASNTTNAIITFSHFLPRIDIMPSYIPQKFRNIYPVLGSPLLDKQIRQLNAHIHIYGHSHVNQRTTRDGVQYINNAFGNPTETRIARKSLLQIV